MKNGYGRNRIKRHMVDVDGTSIFCRDTVEGERSILCLHGKWGRGETWSDFISRYGGKYRIIAPDQRGHGLSGRPVARYAAEDFAKDAKRLVDELDCAPVIVVGHSMGGMTAAHLAAIYPEAVRACIILDISADGRRKTVSELPPDEVQPVDVLTDDWPTPYGSRGEALRDLYARFEYESNAGYFMESLVETMDGYGFMFSPYAMAAMDEYYREWYDILPKIECPVLLVRAGESWCMSGDQASRMIPLIRDCTYFEVPGSDHAMYLDNPDGFYPGLEEFLNRLEE